MKMILVIGFVLSSISPAIAQSANADISATLDAYFKLVERKNIGEALDYVHPHMIDLLGKDLITEQYQQMFNAQGVEISLSDFTTDKISPLFSYEGGQYAIVDYSMLMTISLTKVEEGSDMSAFMLDIYKSQYGADNVTEEKAGTYLIKAKRQMYATKLPDFDDWKLLDYEPEIEAFLTNIIPEAQRQGAVGFMEPEDIAAEVLQLFATEVNGKTWAKVSAAKPAWIIRAPGDKGT